MARGAKRMEEEEQELDLAPIMNMVVILIPLLLLSVVFIEVAVINITAPKLSVGPSTETPPENEEKPLNLTVAIDPKGLRITAEGGVRPAVAGCPADGPTICLRKSGVDVSEKFRQARQKIAEGERVAGEALIEEALGAYNWRELYNQLSGIKAKYDKETIINVTSDPMTPFSALVRLMDVSRYKLEKNSYAKDEAFWSAKPEKTKNAKGKSTYADLFSDPVLTLAQ